jgi:hypothetical protein
MALHKTFIIIYTCVKIKFKLNLIVGIFIIPEEETSIPPVPFELLQVLSALPSWFALGPLGAWPV